MCVFCCPLVHMDDGPCSFKGPVSTANIVPHLRQHSSTYLKGHSSHAHCLILGVVTSICYVLSYGLTLAIFLTVLLVCHLPWLLFGLGLNWTPPIRTLSLTDYTYCLLFLYCVRDISHSVGDCAGSILQRSPGSLAGVEGADRMLFRLRSSAQPYTNPACGSRDSPPVSR